jgi:hypothetical protein
MVYVIKSLGMKDPKKGATIDNAVEVIKIGFSDDKNIEKRLKCYKCENMIFEILFTIPGGTMEDEKRLHMYFKDLKYIKGSEWFYVDKDNTIMNFFNKYKTIEEIRIVIGPFNLERRVDWFNYHCACLRIIAIYNYLFPDKEAKIKNYKFIDNLRKDLANYNFGSLDSFYKWIKNKNIDIDPELIEKLILVPKEYKEKVDEFFVKFRELKTLGQKLKYFCEFPCDDDTKKFIQNQITEKHFNEYLDTLGPEQIKAEGYNITGINKRLGIISFNKLGLITKIRETFEVGGKYSRLNIKNSLRDIYTECGYEKSPVASDLDNYFNLKVIKVKDNTGKFVSGYEILSSK